MDSPFIVSSKVLIVTCYRDFIYTGGGKFRFISLRYIMGRTKNVLEKCETEYEQHSLGCSS